MKIVSSGKAIHSQEFYIDKIRRQRIRLTLFLLLFLTLVSVTVYVSRRDGLLIHTVKVEGNTVLRASDVQSKVSEVLLGNYFWVIPHANAVVYPRQSIEQELMRSFPRIKSVRLDITKFEILTVKIVERTPSSLYCVLGTCYFMDENGLVFDNAPVYSGDTYFVYKTDNPVASPVGKYLLPPVEFRDIGRFMSSVSEFGLHPQAFEISVSEYRMVLPNSAKIIWKRSQDLSVVYSNLQSFLLDPKILSQMDFLDKISYLDLTIEDQVRWGFQ